MNSDCNILKADGCDVAVIRVDIKDAKDRVVPTANNLLEFLIDVPGKIIGIGNGDCLVSVQTNKQAGEIRLKASSD